MGFKVGNEVLKSVGNVSNVDAESEVDAVVLVMCAVSKGAEVVNGISELRGWLNAGKKFFEETTGTNGDESVESTPGSTVGKKFLTLAKSRLKFFLALC